MNNKVLVKISVLELGTYYDIFLPVNEVVWKIKKLIIKAISDLINIPEFYENEFVLINKKTGEKYNNNDIVINTNIRNGTELIILINKSL